MWWIRRLQMYERRERHAFIDEKYYRSSYERGGLLDDSIWKTDTAYVSALRTVFRNLKNDAPVETYTINGETRRKIRQYVDAHGFGDSREGQEHYRECMISILRQIV